MQTTFAPRQQLHIAVQETRIANARFMANASTWSMDTDTPVDVDVFALIIAMSQHLRPSVPFNYLTPSDIAELHSALPTYCCEANTFMPDDFAEQLAMFIAFLEETNWLHNEIVQTSLLATTVTR